MVAVGFKVLFVNMGQLIKRRMNSCLMFEEVAFNNRPGSNDVRLPQKLIPSFLFGI